VVQLPVGSRAPIVFSTSWPSDDGRSHGSRQFCCFYLCKMNGHVGHAERPALSLWQKHAASAALAQHLHSTHSTHSMHSVGNTAEMSIGLTVMSITLFCGYPY
jgi:hypothetical protein